MKLLKSHYIVLSEGRVYISTEVFYYGNSSYVVILQDKRNIMVESDYIILLNNELFKELFDAISKSYHHSNNYSSSMITLDKHSIPYNIHNRGVVEMKYESQTFIGYFYIKKQSVCPEYFVIISDTYSHEIRPCRESGDLFIDHNRPNAGYTKKCQLIYDFILSNPRLTANQIAQALNMSTSSVTPRIAELSHVNRIKEFDKIPSGTANRKTVRWVVNG